jgi:hypothetical protein
LNREGSIPGFAALCAIVAALWASGCAVSLAPGYTVVKETRTIQFVPGSPSELQISLRFELKNTGTAALPFVDLNFPGAKTFGTRNLRVSWDGRKVQLEEIPEQYRVDYPNTRRIDFEPSWARGRTGELGIDYVFASPRDFGTHITISDQTFHLGSLGWAALPQPPQHFLSPYPTRPPTMTYSVSVPGDFLVLGRGQLKHRRANDGRAEYEFQLKKSNLAPFVVAGHYVETRLRGGSVVFWTLGPLAEKAGSTPQRVAKAWATLEKDFGPIDTEVHVPHIVVAPTLRSSLTEGTGPAVASFPGGVLVNEQTLALGIASDAFVERVSHALAHNWFTDQMYPTGAAALAMGEGLPEYATIVIDEAEGGSQARRDRIEYFLSRYNEARNHAQEKPLGVTMLTDSPGQREIALAKAPLMYAALENHCGEAPVRNGLKNLVTVLSGQQVGLSDLRSAIEQTCGSDLGEFFREWLYGQGVPAGFAARYESAQRP